jgi:hypothetical protein
LVYEKDLRLTSVLPLLPKDERPPDDMACFNVTRLDIALDEFYSEDGNYHLLDLFERFHE